MIYRQDFLVFVWEEHTNGVSDCVALYRRCIATKELSLTIKLAA